MGRPLFHRPRSWPSFTVLHRELAQLAAQRNTYILRGLYALTVAVVGLSIVASFFNMAGRRLMSGYNAAGLYGVGDQLLDALLIFALISTGAVLPAMVVGSVTAEREQGTLDLMRVSRLTAGDIVLQKYLARLIPFGLFLLLLVPLAAVAYGLGGVSTGDLLGAVATLLSAVLRVAAIALLCSALCGSTLSAFLTAYLVILVLYVGVPVLWETVLWPHFYWDDDWLIWWVIGPWMDTTSVGGQIGYVCLLLLGLCGCLAWTCACLKRARQPRGALAKRLHSGLDKLLERLNAVAGNIRWGQRGGTLPDAAPVAWRERSRTAVCIPRHMFRLLCLVCVPTVFMLLFLTATSPAFYASPIGYSRDATELSIFLAMLWLPAALVPAVYVANLISGERSDQTLDVLLTTPIAPREILRQKMAAVRRVVLLVTLPIVMTILVECYGEYLRQGLIGEGLLYLAVALGSVLVFEAVIVWTALGCSLRVRRRSAVVMLTLVRLLGYAFVPLLLGYLVVTLSRHSSDLVWVMAVSPVGAFIASEFSELNDLSSILAAFAGLSLYLVLALVTRHRCYTQAAHLLHRTPRV
jgi:ABC-type transport system involved in multi-copper enzyme maturation permease subunit